MPKLQTITPCLWFDGQAEAAVTFYTGIFKNSKITTVSRYTEAGREIHQKPPGSVMVMAFELEGQSFTALNGGPQFKFSEAISFQINCDTQDEIDYYWAKLSEGGDERAQQCGWLKDKFGLSWQVVPKMMGELFKGSNTEGAQRAMTAMLKMKKLNIAELQRAYSGNP
jgi:predicted 3-demethylubiquinone-9 3-methyltransferase (glyoxalase superfamily)